MNVVKIVGKTKDDALNNALNVLNADKDNICYNFKEVKGGLFKGVTYECSAFLKSDIILETQNFLKIILNNMGIDAHFEIITKDSSTIIKIYSSNNSIIIGHNGKNLEALTVLARQFINKFTCGGVKIILDVENYKDRQLKRLERLAFNLAKDVVKTKSDIEMDNMNSYERRIVHNALANFKGVKTESVGEDPNRHVIIKYIEERL